MSSEDDRKVETASQEENIYLQAYIPISNTYQIHLSNIY